jgi:hypothetical protein
MRSSEHRSLSADGERLLARPPAVMRRMIACFMLPHVFWMLFLMLPWSPELFHPSSQAMFWSGRLRPTLSVLVSLVLWAWSTRRLRRRLAVARGCVCVRCGYVVAGLGPTGNCPECGLRFDRDRTVQAWIALRLYRPDANSLCSPSDPVDGQPLSMSVQGPRHGSSRTPQRFDRLCLGAAVLVIVSGFLSVLLRPDSGHGLVDWLQEPLPEFLRGKAFVLGLVALFFGPLVVAWCSMRWVRRNLHDPFAGPGACRRRDPPTA